MSATEQKQSKTVETEQGKVIVDGAGNVKYVNVRVGTLQVNVFRVLAFFGMSNEYVTQVSKYVRWWEE